MITLSRRLVINMQISNPAESDGFLRAIKYAAQLSW
jgi:hypothetical protein